MTTQRQQRVDVTNEALDQLRAAKGHVSSRYALSTEEHQLPEGNEADEDTPDTTGKEGTPTSTPSPDTIKDPSHASKPLTPDTNDVTSTLEKRISDKDRYITELKQQMADLKASMENEPVKLPKSEEELASWMSRNKEQADLLVTLIAKQNETLVKELQATKASFEEIQRKNRNEVLFQEVLKTHSDAGQIRESEDFKSWFADQTPTVQALIESTSAQDIARGISLYKADKGIGTKTRKSGKSAEDADFVTTKGGSNLPTPGKVWTASEVKKLNDRQYAQYRDEIKAAQREGRFDPNT